MTSIESKVAAQLVRARKDRDMTQQVAANAIGISEKALRLAEKNGRVPKQWMREAIERVYGIAIWSSESAEVPVRLVREVPENIPADEVKRAFGQIDAVSTHYRQRVLQGANAGELARLREELLLHISNVVEAGPFDPAKRRLIAESFMEWGLVDAHSGKKTPPGPAGTLPIAKKRGRKED
jgi:DNA-binding XRE family transcriptional regulator